MSEYTKGEWIASDGGKSNYVASVTAKSARGKAFNVALCARPMHGCAVANARLIAAAPELLEALEDIVNNEYGTAAIARARAAIAKATPHQQSNRSS